MNAINPNNKQFYLFCGIVLLLIGLLAAFVLVAYTFDLVDATVTAAAAAAAVGVGGNSSFLAVGVAPAGLLDEILLLLDTLLLVRLRGLLFICCCKVFSA